MSSAGHLVVDTPDRPTAPSAPPNHTVLATFIGRSVRLSVRNLEALTMAIVLPTMLMLLFTWVFGGAMSVGDSYVTYVVPGIVLLCAGFGAASTAVDVATDMRTGVIDRFRTMPIPGSGVLAGHVVASLLRNLVATGVVLLVALTVGFRPNANLLEWLATLGIVALWIFTITYIFAAIGLAASSPEAANGYGFILLFLPYISSAFVPVHTMPAWLQTVSRHQPVTPVTETIRGLLTGTPIGSNAVLAVTWCGGLLALAIVWAAWLFRRKASHR